MRQIVASMEPGKSLQSNPRRIEVTETNMNRRDGLILTGAITACLGLGILTGRFYPHWKSGLPSNLPQAIVLNADPTCNPLGATCVAGNEAFTIALELAHLTKPLIFFPFESISLEPKPRRSRRS